jgi:hypothetical protein
MTEINIKRRLNRAIAAAAKILNNPPGTAEIIILKNHVFHLEAIRKKEIRKIRITLDQIKKQDEELVLNYPLPENFTKEIWCRKINGKFTIKIIHN